MKNDWSITEILAAIVGLAVFVVLMMVYGVIANAYVGKVLWQWFIVSTFGLKPLSIAQAYGISLLTHFWTYQVYEWKGKDERTGKEKVLSLVGVVLFPWFTLLLGWFVHSFLM